MKIVYLSIIALLLNACASMDITSVPKNPSQHPFSKIMVVCVETSDDLKQLNSEIFDSHIRGQFNDIENLKFRNQLERTLQRNLGRYGLPKVIKSSEIFNVDQDYTYEQFCDEIGKTGAEAVLLINTRNYWFSSRYVTTHYNHSSVTNEETEPNSTYYAYLYPASDLENYLWIGRINVSGIWAGYDTLNNYLARGVTRMMRKENYIF